MSFYSESMTARHARNRQRGETVMCANEKCRKWFKQYVVGGNLKKFCCVECKAAVKSKKWHAANYEPKPRGPRGPYNRR